MQHDTTLIKPYTHQQLSDLYGVSWNTMLRWIRAHKQEIGPKIGYLYTTRQVEIIFDRLGWPPGNGLAD